MDAGRGDDAELFVPAGHLHAVPGVESLAREAVATQSAAGVRGGDDGDVAVEPSTRDAVEVIAVQVGQQDRVEARQAVELKGRVREPAGPETLPEVGPLTLVQEVGSVRTVNVPSWSTVVAVPTKVSAARERSGRGVAMRAMSPVGSFTGHSVHRSDDTDLPHEPGSNHHEPQ